MSEPLPKGLNRFTPNPGGLDRDALLFAAGRASARTSRVWKVAAGALAVSQLLTLMLLWPRPAPPAVAPAPSPVAPAVIEPVVPAESDTDGPRLLSLRRNLPGSAADLSDGQGVEDLIESGPPLRAFSAPPAGLR
jgi:hypothetical protein